MTFGGIFSKLPLKRVAMEFQNLEKNDRLGRGLSALLGPEHREGARVLSIDIDKIHPAKNQPRKRFEESALEELALSIKKHGVLQPILVKKDGAGYEIIAGERRWRAVARAGLHKIPALIKAPEKNEDHFWTLAENLQREDLNPIETARACAHILKAHNLNKQQLADLLGKKRPTLVNVLRLLQLSPAVQKQISEGRLSLGLAKELLRVQNPEEQTALGEKCFKERWTVQKLRAALESAEKPKVNRSGKAPPPWTKALTARLEKRFSRRVSLSFKKGKGQISFPFQSEKELKTLVEKLCQKPPSF